MKYDIDDQTMQNLKDKIDALIEKGSELSKNLSVDERYDVMKRVILDGVNKALLNTTLHDNTSATSKKITQNKEKLIEFVRVYFEEKFSERLAAEWDDDKGKV